MEEYEKNITQTSVDCDSVTTDTNNPVKSPSQEEKTLSARLQWLFKICWQRLTNSVPGAAAAFSSQSAR